MGMFKRPYLKMGAPANDDRVREIIVVGRAKMPAFGHVLNDDEIDKLIAYLHTL
jgi:mono/diheme cytochrome c family protein